jgi:hypothetical protein
LHSSCLYFIHVVFLSLNESVLAFICIAVADPIITGEGLGSHH